jgi:hypothetical protein
VAAVREAAVSVPRLVTFALSHYCEKARWDLGRAGVPYREQGHAPGFRALAVRRAGGRRGTPMPGPYLRCAIHFDLLPQRRLTPAGASCLRLDGDERR